MNCLAHALIAARRGESVVGNLLGDFVHGRVDDRYEADFAQGIRIHRAIDAFTDAHPRTLVSRQRLRTPYRRWGGVLIDVFYDHFLANDWSTHSNATLREFADDVYAALAHRRNDLPARMQGFAHYMASTDLLVAYRDVSGIDRALKGLSTRVRRDNPLHDASGELVRLFAELEGDFRAFFPDLLEEFAANAIPLPDALEGAICDGTIVPEDDMDSRETLVDYYSRRAREYDRIYEKPERQEALAELRALVEDWTDGERVLELACGTGYWTEVMARGAASVLATDTNATVLQLARERSYPTGCVEVRPADAFAPEAIPGTFTCAFAGFWVSHLRRDRTGSFLSRLHARLGPGTTVILLDNQFVEGSNTPISRTDGHGNTMQTRTLATGDEFEIVKNFLEEDDVRLAAGSDATELEFHDLHYFWAVRYRLRST